MTLHTLRHLLASWNTWRADRRLARLDPERYAAKVRRDRLRRQHRSTRAAEAPTEWPKRELRSRNNLRKEPTA